MEYIRTYIKWNYFDTNERKYEKHQRPQYIQTNEK